MPMTPRDPGVRVRSKAVGIENAGRWRRSRPPTSLITNAIPGRCWAIAANEKRFWRQEALDKLLEGDDEKFDKL